MLLASGKIDEVRRLRDLGMDLNSTNSQGRTGLHIAACQGDKLMVECLLGMNVQINKVDCFGHRPLNVSLLQELVLIYSFETPKIESKNKTLDF